MKAVRKSYSIAEARNSLPGIIRDVERGRPVEISRRGTPVAVILSLPEFHRIQAARPAFSAAYGAWRKTVNLRELGVGPEYFDALRDRSLGRGAKL
jgi:prevent-host-death family protein